MEYCSERDTENDNQNFETSYYLVAKLKSDQVKNRSEIKDCSLWFFQWRLV